MLSSQKFHIDDYKDIIIFTLGTLVKLLILHYFIGIRDDIGIVTLKNFLIIIAIYCLVCFVKPNKRAGALFTINIIISMIFFVDTVYYSHFFTLIPVHSVYQIGQVGSVSESIFSLIRLEYFLFFADSLVLWRYHKKQRRENIKQLHCKQKKIAFLMMFCILASLTTGMTYKTVKDTNGNYTPQNLGVLNYHLLDTVDHFTKDPLDVKRAEEVVETIAPADYNKKEFGAAAHKNIIVIQAESLQNFVINKEIEGQMITPVLNELIAKDSIYFSRYYEQVGWGNTSDAEFISHNSFYPSLQNSSYMAYEDNDFSTLPMLLKEEGYSTIAFHGNTANFWNREDIYPSQGLDTFISLEKLQQDDMIGIGLSDESLFRQSIDYLKNQKQPFYGFYVTLTSHHPFTMDEQYKGLDIEGEYKNTLLEDYLQTVHYLDGQIGNFIKMLKEEGLYEDTMIIIYGDHQGLDMREEEPNELLSSFLGKSYREDEMFNVPLIAHIPHSNFQKEVRTTGGQIDFLPTIGNLLGLEVDPNKVFGKDLLNTGEGFVAQQVHMARGSFIDDEKIFVMSEDGLFENSIAWNVNTGQPIDIEKCRDGYERALAEVNLSEYILQNNLIPLVKEKGLEYIVENRPGED